MLSLTKRMISLHAFRGTLFVLIGSTTLSCHKESTQTVPEVKKFATDVVFKDAQTGEAVQGLKVSFTKELPEFSYPSTTDNDGKASYQYRFGEVSDGPNWIRVSGDIVDDGNENFHY